jgi:hypothetical protein
MEGSMATGTTYQSSGSFYVQYSVGMAISKNGKPRPIQKFHRLCEKNDKYYSGKAREVKLPRDAFMLTVNARQANAVAEDMRALPRFGSDDTCSTAKRLSS